MKKLSDFINGIRPSEISKALGRPIGNSSRDKATMIQRAKEVEEVATSLGFRVLVLEGKVNELVIPVISEEDAKYYGERAWDIINHGGFQYVTTNEFLHQMKRFVQNEYAFGNEVDLVIEKGKIILRTRFEK